ncbi:TniB protein [Ruegeria intermedia]|uniref:TniB protein n=2 Tax=Ruegeria intermedia TaxID=996115 RepID=A0A1M4Y981_9RHOB|nr:TniB protein [Ruegeria intermedia]
MMRPDPVTISQRLRALHIPNQRDTEIERQLRRLLQHDEHGQPTAVPCRFTGEKETRGIAVIEPAGGGKTTAIRRVLEASTALSRNPSTGQPRFLALEVPSPATLKGVGATILGALGMPIVPQKCTEVEIWHAVRHRLGQAGITVLWLDEAHDLLMAKSISETESSLRMIKSLMQGPNAIIPILSGTQRLAEVLGLDPQVSRRFTKIVPADLQHGADEEGLKGLIQHYCSKAEMSMSLAEDLPARLITASRHRFGRAVEAIINAIECALWDGATMLTSDHFAEAWAMQEGCSPDDNVFLSRDWLSIQLDRGAAEYEEARKRRFQKKLERV